jgi:hypothetical protein
MFILDGKQVEEQELIKSLKSGDVGCVHENRNPMGFVIQKFTNSPINHVYIYSGIVLDANHNVFGINRNVSTNLIIEALAAGVSVTGLHGYARNSCKVYFIRHSLINSLDGQKVVNNMFKLVNHPYDWTGIAGFLFRKIIPFRYNFLNKKYNYFCSEAVATSFAEERLFFDTSKDCSYISPADIWNSKMSIHL